MKVEWDRDEWYVACPTAWDGYPTFRHVVEIPDELWERYKLANEEFQAVHAELDQYDPRTKSEGVRT